MKIGMTGAHGTGKTSMAQAMIAHPAFKYFSMVPSTARQIAAYGYPINREATEISQLLVPVMRILDESETKGDLISDRTIIDSMAYTCYQNAFVWLHGALVENVTRRLMDWYMETYGIILYFPVYWPLSADGIRDTDEEYRDTIDDTIKMFLPERAWTVPDISPEERCEWLIRRMEKEGCL